MLAEFKEKTFEKYFGFELARLTKITFSPDQCDEAFLGFDDAFFLPWPFLKGFLPHTRRNRWHRLHGLDVRQLDQIVDEISAKLPPFKFNLFIQYKRPEYLSRSSAAEWSCWQQPYFRYETTPHQHDLLAKIDHHSHGRAATIYAVPAFWRNDDLWSYVQAARIVDESNIASVGRLNGHSRFTYCAPGCSGKGHSDPVDLESPPIAQILETGMTQEGLPFNRHIKRMARQLEEIMSSDDFAAALVQQARATILNGDGPAATQPLLESLTYALATIEAFSDCFDVSFYAMG